MTVGSSVVHEGRYCQVVGGDLTIAASITTFGEDADIILVSRSGDISILADVIAGDGDDGTPESNSRSSAGERGGAGGSVVLYAPEGTIVIEDAHLHRGNGGRGGDAESTAVQPGDSALAGRGGDAGLLIASSMNYSFDGVSHSGGVGGHGGAADLTSVGLLDMGDSLGAAIGGTGGRGGPAVQVAPEFLSASHLMGDGAIAATDLCDALQRIVDVVFRIIEWVDELVEIPECPESEGQMRVSIRALCDPECPAGNGGLAATRHGTDGQDGVDGADGTTIGGLVGTDGEPSTVPGSHGTAPWQTAVGGDGGPGCPGGDGGGATSTGGSGGAGGNGGSGGYGAVSGGNGGAATAGGNGAPSGWARGGNGGAGLMETRGGNGGNADGIGGDGGAGGSGGDGGGSCVAPGGGGPGAQGGAAGPASGQQSPGRGGPGSPRGTDGVASSTGGDPGDSGSPGNPGDLVTCPP